MTEPDFDTVFSKLSPQKKAIVMWRKYDNPDLTLKECLHDCITQGHLPIPDQERDLDWNEHFMLLPQICKICGLREFKVLKVVYRYSEEILKRSGSSD